MPIAPEVCTVVFTVLVTALAGGVPAIPNLTTSVSAAPASPKIQDTAAIDLGRMLFNRNR